MLILKEYNFFRFFCVLIIRNNCFLLTRVRVGRNVHGFGLCPGMTKDERIEVEDILKRSVMNFEDELKGEYFSLSGLDEEVEKNLEENKFLFSSGDPNLSIAGMERDWPEARGIFHNDAKTLLAWINEEDHLRIISLEAGIH